jgi:hypothetical protein
VGSNTAQNIKTEILTAQENVLTSIKWKGFALIVAKNSWHLYNKNKNIVALYVGREIIRDQSH